MCVACNVCMYICRDCWSLIVQCSNIVLMYWSVRPQNCWFILIRLERLFTSGNFKLASSSILISYIHNKLQATKKNCTIYKKSSFLVLVFFVFLLRSSVLNLPDTLLLYEFLIWQRTEDSRARRNVTEEYNNTHENHVTCVSCQILRLEII